MKVLELDDLEQGSSSSVLPSGKAEMQQGTELPRVIQFEQATNKQTNEQNFASYPTIVPLSVCHISQLRTSFGLNVGLSDMMHEAGIYIEFNISAHLTPYHVW